MLRLAPDLPSAKIVASVCSVTCALRLAPDLPSAKIDRLPSHT